MDLWGSTLSPRTRCEPLTEREQVSGVLTTVRSRCECGFLLWISVRFADDVIYRHRLRGRNSPSIRFRWLWFKVGNGVHVAFVQRSRHSVVSRSRPRKVRRWRRSTVPLQGQRKYSRWHDGCNIHSESRQWGRWMSMTMELSPVTLIPAIGFPNLLHSLRMERSAYQAALGEIRFSLRLYGRNTYECAIDFLLQRRHCGVYTLQSH